MKVYAEAVANLNIGSPNLFYFFFDLDGESLGSVDRYFGSWCDILKTEGGFIVKSHESFEYWHLGEMLRNAKIDFPKSDYHIEPASNLWIRTSAKWVEHPSYHDSPEKNGKKEISHSPRKISCPDGQSCPYTKTSKNWLRKKYTTGW